MLQRVKGVQEMLQSGSVSVPGWVLSAIGATASLLLAGAIAWMSTLASETKANTVSLAEVRTQVANHDDALTEIKKSIERVDNKMDHVLEMLNDMRVKIGIAGP